MLHSEGVIWIGPERNDGNSPGSRPVSRRPAGSPAEKFYALVAYPGSSGFLHVGHLRGLAYADALHRFYRMRGRQVFFPTGTHATGLPSVTFAQKVADRDPSIVAQLQLNGVPESEWPSLEDPATAARFLGRNYLGVFRALGLLLDESAYVTTIDEDYQAFIRWQFARLIGPARSSKPRTSPRCAQCVVPSPLTLPKRTWHEGGRPSGLSTLLSRSGWPTEGFSSPAHSDPRRSSA